MEHHLWVPQSMGTMKCLKQLEVNNLDLFIFMFCYIYARTLDMCLMPKEARRRHWISCNYSNIRLRAFT